jgi:hypothetical protein
MAAPRTTKHPQTVERDMLNPSEGAQWPSFDEQPHTTSQSKTRAKKAPVTRSFVCDFCGHRILRALTRENEDLELDTECTCWVVSGQQDRNGLPVYSRSMGYPLHRDVCPVSVSQADKE